jgi:hypothetical protein
MSSGQLYKPYLSDSEYESNSDTDVETDGYTTEESLCSLPGRNPPVETGVPANVPIVDEVKITGTKFETAESRNTFLITINSRDRDTNVFPQPTFFTIRLPRVLRNVKQINIQQLNLLNSFFNFSITKGNTFMHVLEQGRTRIEGSNIVPNDVKINIRNGTYTADDLVLELTNALNTTPLFSGLTFGDFGAAFRTTGDYSILFNTPGPIVFNSLTQAYDRNQTLGNIVSRYFQVVQTVGNVSFTDNQILVAYYYPVIKEMIIASPDVVPFDTANQEIPPGFVSWFDYLVFAFQGLDDPYVTNIVQVPTNIPIFTAYRNANTFNSFLANKYTCTYNSKQGRLIISAPSLNDSIVNDLNTTYSNILETLVFEFGFQNISDFQNQYNAIQNLNGSLLEFYNFVQKQFAVYLGVNFGKYSETFYENLSNEITIFNTVNRFGWNTSVNAAQLGLQSNFPTTQISTVWSNIVFPMTPSNMYFASTITVPEFTDDYLFFSNAGENTFGYTDSVFTVYPTAYNRINFKSRCRQNVSFMTIPRYLNNRGPDTDMIFNLGSNTTPLLFTSPAPSTFFILSDISGNLDFNMYTVTQVMFFTASFMRGFDEWINYLRPQFIAGSRVQETDPNFNLPPTVSSIYLASFRKAIFFQVNADQYGATPNAHFNISFYVETQDGTNFPVPVKITWYKDRAVFMADALQELEVNLGTEDPRHYFKTQTFIDVSSAVMTVDVSNLQTTYFHVNFESVANLPSQIPLRIFCLLTDDYGVYSTSTIFNGFGLPWSNLPPIVDQFTPESAIYDNPLKSIYLNSITQLGYDISTVSNNLLDYSIRSGSNYYDPVSIQDFESLTRPGLRYTFLLGCNGSAQPNPGITPPDKWSLYFYPGSCNTIRDLYNTVSNVYLAGGQTPKPLPPGSSNKFILTNWLQPASVVKERFDQPSPTTNINTRISTSSAFLPCINNIQVITDASTLSSYVDSNGIAGVGFYLPPNSVVKMDSMVFKFAYMQPAANLSNVLYTRVSPAITSSSLLPIGNIYRTQATPIRTSNSPIADWDDWYLYNRRNIKLGIYRASDINNTSYSNLSISSAIMTMTLQTVSQVGNYQNLTGSVRLREPDWGTYYIYAFDSNQRTVWDVANVNYTGVTTPINSWKSTIVARDFAPTYIAGETSTANFFLTNPTINNYNYLPRSYGIGPAVGNAINFPVPGISSYTTDISAGYVAVPFYYDSSTSSFQIGSFFGLSYTDTPTLPSTTLIGAAPYYGPPGPFGWRKDNTTSTLQLYSTSASSLTPFYWNTKVKFEALDTQYNPATDLSNFGYYENVRDELQDTVLFLYSNSSPLSDLKDISSLNTTTGTYNWVWGQESVNNYIEWDDQNGYNFLSYIHNAQIRSNDDGYTNHVRAYNPIPQFTTGLRFIGKNFTDFGSPTLLEIASEIASISSYTYITDPQANVWVQNPAASISTFSTNAAVINTSFISREYANALKLFDFAFSTTQTFGRKSGFPGVTFSTIGYSNAITEYSLFTSSTRGSLVLYTTILSTASGLLNQYVLDRYGNILPTTIINRNRITDPLPFSFLFSTMTMEPYKSLPDQWGLGWNIGFNKVDTIPRTTITSDTFIRITQDYIYLRLNPEFNINTLAVSGKENLSESREARSQDTLYFSKILLNNFGSFSRAAVQLPKLFNPVLGKYDTVRCELVDQFGVQINNIDCDYDFVLEVTEIDQRPKDTASLILPQTANPLEIISARQGTKKN